MSKTLTLTLETVEGEGLRFRSEIAAGITARTDSGPARAHANPIELLLVALGGCQAMDVISILRKQQQRVTAYQVTLDGERRTEHPRAYTRIDVVHRVTGHALSSEAVARAIELSHTKYCSVQASLDPAIPITHRFELIPA